MNKYYNVEIGIERRKDAEQEIERLHKQDGNGDAPRYFSLSEGD